MIVRPASQRGEQAELRANLTTFRKGKVVEMVAYQPPEEAFAAAGVATPDQRGGKESTLPILAWSETACNLIQTQDTGRKWDAETRNDQCLVDSGAVSPITQNPWKTAVSSFLKRLRKVSLWHNWAQFILKLAASCLIEALRTGRMRDLGHGVYRQDRRAASRWSVLPVELSSLPRLEHLVDVAPGCLSDGGARGAVG